MSTRSYITIRRGDECRTIYVHWDGLSHGDTLLKLPDADIDAIWDAIGKNPGLVTIEHLYTPAAWKKYVKRNPQSESNKLGRLGFLTPVLADRIGYIMEKTPTSANSSICTLDNPRRFRDIMEATKDKLNGGCFDSELEYMVRCHRDGSRSVWVGNYMCDYVPIPSVTNICRWVKTFHKVTLGSPL